jgi:2-polyprenyl-6-methoxyphenol hydroxylase-like FAD-dependent oxidoreductase
MRVVIVGAGLSGLTLAAFLRRVNVDCVLLEQAPYLQANFQLPVTLFANALSCYKAYSLGQIFEDPSFTPETSFGIRNSTNGQWLLEMRNRDVQLTALGEDDAIPLSTAPPANSESIVSRRVAEAYRMELGRVPLRTTLSAGQLKKTLRQFAPEIKLNAKVVDLVPHDGIKGGVHVIMEDGRSEWGDIVVGADGMHSTIRKLLYPGEHAGINSHSLGMTTIDGYVDLTTPPATLGEHICEFWGHKRTVSYYPLFHHNEGRVAFSATLYEAPKGAGAGRSRYVWGRSAHNLSRVDGEGVCRVSCGVGKSHVSGKSCRPNRLVGGSYYAAVVPQASRIAG